MLSCWMGLEHPFCFFLALYDGQDEDSAGLQVCGITCGQQIESGVYFKVHSC